MSVITSEVLAETIKNIKNNDHNMSAQCAVHLLLIQSLAPMESKVYILISSLSSGDYYTSRDIAEYLNIRINRAGNILGHLRQLNLIESKVRTGKNGLYYEWRIKND